MNEQKNKSSQFDLLIKVIENISKIIVEGYNSQFYLKVENIALIIVMSVSLALFVAQNKFDMIFKFLSLDIFIRPMHYCLNIFDFKIILLVSLVFVVSSFFLFYGWTPYRTFRKYQLGLDHLDLKSGLGHRPTLLVVESIDDNRTKLVVQSTGLGEERYKKRLDDLRASVGQMIESVSFLKKDTTKVEIFLAKRLLANKVLYADLAKELKRPYSFIVGKSQAGVVTESLEDVPHYMIAGSTNGGKSLTFKSVILGLLESSTKLQLYLFDFKRVEVNDFLPLPNVTIVKEEQYAQFILENLEREMERRYSILERDGFKKIDPIRDNLNRIVVAIDECTDLTGKVPKSNPQYAIVERARNSLDHLARKARACGIHLIFATQKIDRHSMDTRVQENIEGRISHRMNSVENSVRVLQNAMSCHLPSVPGRAIWKRGADYTEVQCPFFTDEELKSRIKALVDSKKFENQGNLVIKKAKEIKLRATPKFTAVVDHDDEA